LLISRKLFTWTYVIGGGAEKIGFKLFIPLKLAKIKIENNHKEGRDENSK
jgi:hypothetical protein